MSKIKRSTIAVRGTAISIVTGKAGDYISLTDMLMRIAARIISINPLPA